MKNSAAAAAGFGILAQTKRGAVGANEKVVIGVMGLGGQGTRLATWFAQRADAEIAYVCDVNLKRLGGAAGAVEKAQGKAPKRVQDFRRILDDKDVDVLINATPDHWHVLGSILACQAGKDVYVEKPMSHNIWEGRKLIEAEKKYKRVVQVGTQTRSAGYLRDAAEFIRSGKLGDVRLVRVFNMMPHNLHAKIPAATAPVPDDFDYDTWCGPAPKPPYNPARHWLNIWDYSTGAIAGDAVHQLDLARYLIGDKPYPETVVNAGGVMVATDGREAPDTQMVTFEFGKLTLLFEAALWTRYIAKTHPDRRDKGILPNWPFNGTRIEVLGTKGMMYFGRHSDGWQVFDDSGRSIVEQPGKSGDREHHDNFIACIRSRKPANANSEQGHYSALLCHLANISYRTGNRKLVYDGAKESFKDAPEANRYLKRSYRAPWIVPDVV